MANLIEIYFIFLSTTLLFTDAYSGIRHRRSKINDESDLKENKPSSDNASDGENVKISESTWSYHNMDIDENKNVMYNNQMNVNLKSSQDDDAESTVARRSINDNEKPLSEVVENNHEKKVKRAIIDNEKHSIENMKDNPEKTVVKRAVDYNEKSPTDDDSWADLVISFGKLALPYIPEQVSKLNLDWPQLEVAVRSFSHVTTSDVTERSLSDSPLMATIRATTAAATPMIMDGVRALLGMVLDFVDNAGFVTNGHAISRRGVSEGVLDDIMNAFTAVLEHMMARK